MNIKSVLATGALVVASSTASAVVITQAGTDVSFTYNDASLFGTGTVVGNSISFSPTSFSAQSLDGAGNVIVADTLNVTVLATTAGFAMDMFGLQELGDYRISGAPSANADASARFNVLSNTTQCGLFACSANEIFTTGSLADTAGVLTNWSLGGAIDLAATAGWGSDTEVTIQLQNNLLANTGATGDVAFIQKKQNGVGISINPVPVPAAVWLFGSGLISIIGIARRKTS